MDGKKQSKKLYRFVDQCNKNYGALAFLHVIPSKINPNNWTLMKNEDLLKLYNKILHKCLCSGFHDDLPEPDLFSDYAHNNHLILYFHKFMQKYDVFWKMTGESIYCVL